MDIILIGATREGFNNRNGGDDGRAVQEAEEFEVVTESDFVRVEEGEFEGAGLLAGCEFAAG
jgi:hypothetical protein